MTMFKPYGEMAGVFFTQRSMGPDEAVGLRMVESGTTLDNMAWCRRHIFVVNGDDKEGLHCFVCAFHCRVRLERFIIWVWEPLSSIHIIRSFLTAI